MSNARSREDISIAYARRDPLWIEIGGEWVRVLRRRLPKRPETILDLGDYPPRAGIGGSHARQAKAAKWLRRWHRDDFGPIISVRNDSLVFPCWVSQWRTNGRTWSATVEQGGPAKPYRQS